MFGKSNSKQDMGSCGILTDGLINRFEFYDHAMILAMIPFMKPELYWLKPQFWNFRDQRHLKFKGYAYTKNTKNKTILCKNNSVGELWWLSVKTRKCNSIEEFIRSCHDCTNYCVKLILQRLMIEFLQTLLILHRIVELINYSKKGSTFA